MGKEKDGEESLDLSDDDVGAPDLSRARAATAAVGCNNNTSVAATVGSPQSGVAPLNYTFDGTNYTSTQTFPTPSNNNNNNNANNNSTSNREGGGGAGSSSGGGTSGAESVITTTYNPITHQEIQKCGWIEKFSVGRGLFPVRNWQRRYFTMSFQGLNYSKGPSTDAKDRTFIPFIASAFSATTSLGGGGGGGSGNNNGSNNGINSPRATRSESSPVTLQRTQSNFRTTSVMGSGGGPMCPSSEVRLLPVFLLPCITPALHPEATDSNYHYFGVHFEEKGKPHILLLRTLNKAEKDTWCRFLAQFLHVGAMNGVPLSHPIDSKTATSRITDPEELDESEKVVLRKVVIEWDEGYVANRHGEVAQVPLDVDNTAGLNAQAVEQLKRIQAMNLKGVHAKNDEELTEEEVRHMSVSLSIEMMNKMNSMKQQAARMKKRSKRSSDAPANPPTPTADL